MKNPYGTLVKDFKNTSCYLYRKTYKRMAATKNFKWVNVPYIMYFLVAKSDGALLAENSKIELITPKH